MGLFSKETYICEDCGREFESRIDKTIKICDQCQGKFKLLKKDINGYIDYALDLDFSKEYLRDDMLAIQAHRNEIMDKYRMPHPLTSDYFAYARDNYQKMSEEDIQEVILKFSIGTYRVGYGCVATPNFLISTKYDGVVIDADEVFAVVMDADKNYTQGNNAGFRVTLFTNDPYVPVFNMVMSGGYNSVWLKDFSGVQELQKTLQESFHYLRYYVGNIKSLEEEIKADSTVRGNISKEDMLNYLRRAHRYSGIFETKNLDDSLFLANKTQEILSQMGYMEKDDARSCLRPKGLFKRSFWDEKFSEFGI